MGTYGIVRFFESYPSRCKSDDNHEIIWEAQWKLKLKNFSVRNVLNQ